MQFIDEDVIYVVSDILEHVYVLIYCTISKWLKVCINNNKTLIIKNEKKRAEPGLSKGNVEGGFIFLREPLFVQTLYVIDMVLKSLCTLVTSRSSSIDLN